MGDGIEVFDQGAVRRHRERAAAGLGEHDFLLVEVAERLADRLSDVKRRFPFALDLGCHRGEFGRALAGRGGIETLIHCDPSPAMVAHAPGPRLAAAEDRLPFRAPAFDLVTSVLSLHWANDLPGALIQIARCLRPDGLLLAALLGGETLGDLRRALVEAELAERGGASPRVSPFADIGDLGGLLQRAGLAMPVVDADTITVTYPDAFALMADLRGMGESNAVADRVRHFTPRSVLAAAAAAYGAQHGDADGRIPARFQVLYLTAWKPHESQPRALRPGSAEASLAETLEPGAHSRQGHKRV